MKILVVGDWHSELHEEAVARALVQLDQEVTRFPWHQYFKPAGYFGRLRLPALKFQNKYLLGPQVEKLNRELVARVTGDLPDAVFIYRGTHVYPETLRYLRRISPRSVLVGYNNDDPFSPIYPKWEWRHFMAGLPEYDLVLAYRLHNFEDYKRAGAQRVEILRSWYIPEINHPVTLSGSDRQQYGCDVVYIGHHEGDGRVDYLREVVRSGFRLRLWGPGYDWDPVIRNVPELKNQIPVKLVWGEDYNKALAGAKIALCFLSKLNRDTYTRRCFEIPATGTFMFSEYSADLASLFAENTEAQYFRTVDEFKSKLKYYLVESDESRQMIARAGYRKVIAGGHDVCSRMKQILSYIKDIQTIKMPSVMASANSICAG